MPSLEIFVQTKPARITASCKTVRNSTTSSKQAIPREAFSATSGIPATDEQRTALVEFAKDHAGRAGKDVVRVDAAPISMALDTAELRGTLKAGELVTLTTRKARATDCICTNEVAFYPPLAKLDRFAAGVSTEAEYKGKGLGTQWSTPGSRSAYMGEFVYE